MTYQTAVAEALAAWREAEARLGQADPQEPEWHDRYLEAQRAKAHYHEAVDAASEPDETRASSAAVRTRPLPSTEPSG